MLGHYRARPSSQSTANKQIWLVLALGLVAGYFLGMVIMETADVMYSTKLKNHQDALASGAGETVTPNPTTATTTDIDSSRPAQLPDRTTTISTSSSSSSSMASSIGQKAVEKPEGHTVHSLLTSNGSPYQNFQGRIMYGTYKLVQKMPGGEKLTGFTRILHRMTDDGLMDEIPTFRAVPLHPECDTYCDFPVADRPNAVQQWITAVDKDPSLLKGAWVFLLEGDYVWMKPIQAPDAYSNAPGMQFHYDYIQPQYPGVTECLTRLMKLHDLSPAAKDKDAPIPASGPAPALLRFWQLKQITPFWELMTKAIEDDKDAVKLLGWIREMYAWDVGVLLTGAKMMVTEEPGVTQLLAQPPHDTKVGNASLCHYTWGAIYNDTKGEVWRWEKRDYTAPQLALKVPRIPMPPQPFKPNTWHLQDRLPVTQELHETLTAMLGQMNKAIDNLADLTSKARRR